jgi:H+/Cl- antiporter ClcA
MTVRVILRSLIVGFAIMIGAVFGSLCVGVMIYSVFFAKNTSGSGEVAWDLRSILHSYLGPIWTPVLFFAVFLCGFVWAFRYFTKSSR